MRDRNDLILHVACARSRNGRCAVKERRALLLRSDERWAMGFGWGRREQIEAMGLGCSGLLAFWEWATVLRFSVRVWNSNGSSALENSSKGGPNRFKLT